MCDRHIALGRDHITRQHATIANLLHDGHETRLAKVLLQCLLDSQHLHEEHRAYLLKEIDRAVY